MTAIPFDEAIKNTLSPARIGTYEAATTAVPPLGGALDLYAWNALVSSAMLLPLHICEVAVRNAVAEALGAVYGDRWPWSLGFEHSLPTSGGFNMRQHLLDKRSGKPNATKVIPELAFAFWEKMFTGRFDGQIWNAHLRTVLPNIDPAWSVQQARKTVGDSLHHVRGLRNRIAHHEPIIKRSLPDDFHRIDQVIQYRCRATSEWMNRYQQASAFFGRKPP